MEVALLMEASKAVAMEPSNSGVVDMAVMADDPVAKEVVTDNNSKQHQVMAVVMDNSNKEDIDINYPHNHTMMTYIS